MRVATIILAAGASTRLGSALKQLLTHNGKSLIRRITEEALSLQDGPVIVVLGANHERISAELTGLPVITPTNVNWSEGLASSLRTGIALLDKELVDAFLVLLTDQPYITATLLRQLMETRQQTGRGIVACRYSEPSHLGVPALFDVSYKSAFMALKGDTGARKLIQQYATDCAEVPFPLAAIDLDTPQDVARWRDTEANPLH